MRIIRAGEHIQHIPGYGISVRESGVAVAAANWWVVAGKTCVAAYQPKGAASYAASKVNLANPGTYDATNGAAYPTWDAATGWAFNNSAYLLTGISPLTGWSMLARLADADNDTDETAIGCLNSSPFDKRFHLTSRASGNRQYGNGGPIAVAGPVNSGVMAIAGPNCYLNGSLESSAGTYTANGVPIIIGGVRLGGSIYRVYSGKILAVAIYSDTLTTGEVATVSAAMAAL